MGGKSVSLLIAVSAATMLVGTSVGVSVVTAQSVAVGTQPAAVATARVTVDVVDAPLVGVLQAIARQAGLRLFLGKKVIDQTSRVSMRLHDVPADEAFARALSGTGMKAEIASGNVAFFAMGSGAMTVVAQGDVVGKVVDAKTKRPLRGATITLEGTGKGITAGDDGMFRFANVTTGSHTVSVRLLGYVRASKTVVVLEGQTASLEIALEQSVSALDQVVVTGTVAPTELKAVPNAITVITAKQLEERGVTRIEQLFHGDVPGLFAVNRGSLNLRDSVVMFSRGGTSISSANAATNPIKTYVDGVEVTDPAYLNQIDPRSIERIEILSGPQASTMYGSNAINGVMQIFTKRGSSATPQLTMTLLSGVVENNFSRALTPQHDDNAQINGVEGRFSYNAGGSWHYMGAWTPGQRTSGISAFGGSRLALPTAIGPVTADVMLRRTHSDNRQGGQVQQGLVTYSQTGWYNTFTNFNGVATPTIYGLSGQTLGLTLGYAPTTWWSNEFEIGQDVSDSEIRSTDRGFRTTTDTTLSLTQSHEAKGSLRLTSTVRAKMTSVAQMTVTTGIDAWESLVTAVIASPQSLTGTLTGTTTMTRQPGHNRGGFVQAQFAVLDHLFLTYGLRAEWNPNYGADAVPNYSPRYGLAYTQDIGEVTAKVRGSFGRSTRPPNPGLKQDQPANSGYYGVFGPFNQVLANSDLAPESQRGGEGGVDLYFGQRGSLTITRYNQTVDNLILRPLVDSVRSLDPGGTLLGNVFGTDGYQYIYQYQYLNVGNVRNQGWELQGSMQTGPLTTRGTYSWTKSRVIGLTPIARRTYYTNTYYRPGATMLFLPEHTWALGITYAHALSTIALSLTGTGRSPALSNAFYYANLYSGIRLQQNNLNLVNSGAYKSINGAYTLADLTASHRFSAKMDGVLQIQNLGDRYANDWANGAYAVLGRQTKLGLRVRLP